MSSGKIICGGCRNLIEDRRRLHCKGCDQYYDLICANVSEQRFYNTLTGDHRDAWRCVSCINRQPKNDNTPVRSATDGVTLQRGGAAASNSPMDMSFVEQPLSLDEHNDTPHNITMEMMDMQTILMEMRSFREEMRGEMQENRTQMHRMEETLLSLTGRIVECETRVDKFEERLNNLEQRLLEKQDEISLSATIAQLKTEINERDQDLLLNDVEITCIPEQVGENPIHIVTALGNKLGMNLTEQDIVSSVRVGRVIDATAAGGPIISRPRPIVVRLARRVVRDQLIQAARVRRGATTEGTGIPGKPCKFYINERLTKENRQLFRRVREMGRNLNWRFVWTRDGRIFARQYQDKDAPRHRFRTDSDIVRVFGRDTVKSGND